MPRLTSVLALIVVLLVSSTVRARTSPTENERIELEEIGQRLEEALSGEDCATACRGLEDMRRVVRRICRLEPGHRCEQAREREREARERVRTSCPDCDAARERLQVVEEPEAGDEEEELKEEITVEAAGPPREDRSAGGCAGCVVAPRRGGGEALGALLLLALVGCGRRRRRVSEADPPGR